MTLRSHGLTHVACRGACFYCALDHPVTGFVLDAPGASEDKVEWVVTLDDSDVSDECAVRDGRLLWSFPSQTPTPSSVGPFKPSWFYRLPTLSPNAGPVYVHGGLLRTR